MSEYTPLQPEESDIKHPAVGRTKLGEVEFRVAGLLTYLPFCGVNLISSLVWLNSEPKTNRFLRFHAIQSLVLTGGFVAFAIIYSIVSAVLGFIPFLGLMLNMVLGILFMAVTGIYIVANVICMINAYQGKVEKLPILGDVAEQYV